MALHQNVSSTWKSLTAWVNVSGTWKKAAVWKNVSGTWKVITSLLASLLPGSISGNQLKISPTDAVVTMTLSSAGTWTCTGGGSGTWQSGGAASDYEARLTTVSGTLSSGDATGSWLGLGTTRNWTRNETRNGFFSSLYTGTLEVRMAASPFTVLSSTSLSLLAEVEV
jgi:hypothetical protein